MNRYNLRLTLAMLAIIALGCFVFSNAITVLIFAFIGWWRFAHVVSPYIAKWIGHKPNRRVATQQAIIIRNYR